MPKCQSVIFFPTGRSPVGKKMTLQHFGRLQLGWHSFLNTRYLVPDYPGSAYSAVVTCCIGSLLDAWGGMCVHLLCFHAICMFFCVVSFMFYAINVFVSDFICFLYVFFFLFHTFLYVFFFLFHMFFICFLFPISYLFVCFLFPISYVFYTFSFSYFMLFCMLSFSYFICVFIHFLF